MNSVLRKTIPTIISDYLRKWRYDKDSSPFKHKTTEEVFKIIHQQNIWGSDLSASGPGSSTKLSSSAIKGVHETIDSYKIKSILDLPCGDFNWMRHVSLSSIDYIGCDIVRELVDSNRDIYGSDNIKFQQLDLINDDLPQSDLIIVRDCFVHFSYENIFRAIENIKRSKCKYILTTTFNKQRVNYDIATGDWRPINLLLKPFHFPQPLISYEEYYPPKYKKDFRGKSLALWKVEDIKTNTNKN